MPSSSAPLHPDIEKILRLFEAGQLRQAIESFQAIASSADERGELARLCLNLIQEVTTDVGRAVPPSSFKLRQQLLLALGDASDDDIDDLLLWDDLSELPGKGHSAAPLRAAGRTPKPVASKPAVSTPLAVQTPLAQAPGSVPTPWAVQTPKPAPADGLPPLKPVKGAKPSLPPLAQPPRPQASQAPPLPSNPNAGLEHSLLPPMMGDGVDFPALSQFGEPMLPDEANMGSLFGDGPLGKDPFVPPRPSDRSTQVREGIGAAKRPPDPTPVQPSPRTPPLAVSPPVSGGQNGPSLYKPKNFQDLKKGAGEGLRSTAVASAPSKRVPEPSSPALAPAPSGGFAPSVVSPIVEISEIHEIISDATPTAPISSAFQEPPPSTRPRFQGLARPKTPRASTPFPQATTPNYASRCRDLLARSLPLEAFRCLMEYLKTSTANPTDPAVVALQQATEQALRLKALSLLEPLDRIPTLCASPAALMSRSDLDHRAGYLISQIDGMTPLEFLLDLNAMPRQDAALLLLKLIEHGIIAFN